MFTFSCLPQVMERMTKPHTTIIWICWFADRGFKCWKGKFSRARKSDREKRGWLTGMGSAGVRLSVLGQLSHCLAV